MKTTKEWKDLVSIVDFEKKKNAHIDYSAKLKFIEDRAKHYSEKTLLSEKDIFLYWEKHRDYWFVNYYQDINMPLLDKTKIFKNIEELKLSINGEGFRCPSCEKKSDSAYKCNHCGWSAGGIFGVRGKGAHVLITEEFNHDTIFMPIAWECEQ